MWAVRWTTSDGRRTQEWHFAREDEAQETAARLRRGWRKDARAEHFTYEKGT